MKLSSFEGPSGDPFEGYEARGMHPDYVAECLRLHNRYAVEVVEQFNLCPFARVAREKSRVRNVVLPCAGEDLEGAIEGVERAGRMPLEVEIVQLIFPNAGLAFRAFDHHFSSVRNALQQRRPGRPTFVMAAFHPDYPLRGDNASSLVSFLRRSPDPTFQLLRYDLVERFRRDGGNGTRVIDLAEALRGNLPPPPKPSTSERIADDNFETFQRVGAEALDALLRSIHEDRAKSYARFDDGAKGLVAAPAK